ncbi:MAG: VOC family protein [Acidimicrobiales bacterium]|nr:VOC family protein [Acidimicrobiales bacterium]
MSDRDGPASLDLGAFSLSLAVADLAASQAFYEKLGFRATGGSAADNYLIMANGTTLIGLFQGMFEGNILTFNPGLNNDMEQVDGFTDVRSIQQALEGADIELNERVADDNPAGPAHITLVDPDGNAILIDQFF